MARKYPGLTEEKAMTTRDLREYEAWFKIEKLQKLSDGISLQDIIHQALTYKSPAQDLTDEPPEEKPAPSHDHDDGSYYHP